MEAAVVVPVGRIRDDDIRLRGRTVGSVSIQSTKSLRIIITHQINGINSNIYERKVNVWDFGGDMDIAEKAAYEMLYEECEARGLINNKCIVLKNGNIQMDIGKGYKMTFSPEKLDILIKYRWTSHETEYGLIYAKTDTGGPRIWCHRLIINAPEDLQVDHLNGIV